MPTVLSKPVSEDTDDVVEIEVNRPPAGMATRASQKHTRSNSSPPPAQPQPATTCRRKAPAPEPTPEPTPTPEPPSSRPGSPASKLGAPTPSETDATSQFDARSEADSTITSVPHRERTTERRKQTDLQGELEATICRIKNSELDAYKFFEEPKISYKNNPPTHHVFKCKGCNKVVPRKIGVMETANLHSHTRSCAGSKPQLGSLPNFGITGASTKMTAEEVREYCALWCAKDAQPFSIVKDRYLRKLFDPQVRKHLSCHTTISDNIKHMDEATQKDITERLAKMTSVFHIALDMFQADNGTDYMGIILFHHKESANGSLTIERFLLECLRRGKGKTNDLEDEAEQRDSELNFEAALDPEDVDENDIDNALSWALCGEEDKDNEDPLAFKKIELPDIELGTPDAVEQAQAGKVMINVARWAHKTRYLVRAKTIFKENCVEKNVEKLHNVRRDCKTRWNSTGDMAEDGDRTSPAIILSQNNSRLAIPPAQRLVAGDQKYIKAFIRLLEPLKKATLILSRSGVPMLADVIVHFDSLDFEYTNIADNSKETLYVVFVSSCYSAPPVDTSLLKWEKEWIDRATEICEQVYEQHYKPKTAPATSKAGSLFGYSSFMSHMYSSVAAESKGAGGSNSGSVLHNFINGTSVINKDENGGPLFRNPLVWWHNQRVSGNEMNGLTQMALDIMTMPGKAVETRLAENSALIPVTFRPAASSTIVKSSPARAVSLALQYRGRCVRPRAQQLHGQHEKPIARPQPKCVRLECVQCNGHIQSDQATQMFTGHDADINAVYFFSDGIAFTTGSDDALCQQFNVCANCKLNAFLHNNGGVSRLCLAYLVVGCLASRTIGRAMLGTRPR
ncbi:hypothetical protein FRC09_005004, partial [Ceratobasidium sp. 395]